MTFIDTNSINYVTPVLGMIKQVTVLENHLLITVDQLSPQNLALTGLSQTYQISLSGYHRQADRWVGNALGACLSVIRDPSHPVCDLKKLEGEAVILFEHYHNSSGQGRNYVNVTDIFPIRFLPNSVNYSG